MRLGGAWSQEARVSRDLQGQWLVTSLSLSREEQRPLKAGVVKAEKNTARRGIGATVQIRRREGRGSPGAEEKDGNGDGGGWDCKICPDSSQWDL